MKTRMVLCLVVVWIVLYGGSVWGYTEGADNNFFGTEAGSSTTGSEDTFIGAFAGHSNTTGNANSFIGNRAGFYNNTGNYNSFLGYEAGYSNSTGSGNVFLGYRAGYNETGSNKLYIDNSNTSLPLIYGEFNNNIVRVNGSLGVDVSPLYLADISAGGVSESQLHFSLSGTDTGGWITSVLDNNFFLSSGAMYDQAAGGWVPKSPDGMAVMAGSGATGYRVMLRSGCAVGTVCPPVTRLLIDYSGNVGLRLTAPAHPLHLAGGAYSDGANWIDASSREYKEDIESLSTEEALQTMKDLNPVKYAYKADRTQKHVGFIAEDVPELVATKDRKGLSPMDIVAVLTKVLQEQQKTIEEQKREYQKTISTLRERLNELKGKVR